MTSWSERYDTDEKLRAFVDARIAQAGVDVAAARVEHERDSEVIRALQEQIATLQEHQRSDRRSAPRTTERKPSERRAR